MTIAGMRLLNSSNPLLGPTEFRTYYNEWLKTAPANDSDIIPDKPKVPARPRHAGLCADLKSMLEWKALYEPVDPLQTNYLQDPHDEFIDDEDHGEDEKSEAVKRDVERLLNDGPSAEEMMKAVEGIDFKPKYGRLLPDLCATQNHETAIFYWLNQRQYKRPRVVLGHPYESSLFKISMKPVVWLNHVKLSDSDHNELRPRGSVISWGRQADNAKAKQAMRRGGERFFPPAPAQILNPEERMIAMEERAAANDNLATHHAVVLDAAITSPSFKAIGTAFGYREKTAERQGKRLVLEAARAFSKLKHQLAA